LCSLPCSKQGTDVTGMTIVPAEAVGPHGDTWLGNRHGHNALFRLSANTREASRHHTRTSKQPHNEAQCCKLRCLLGAQSQRASNHGVIQSRCHATAEVIWLHGTIRLGIAKAENVPFHKRLNCHDPCMAGLDSCLGFVGNRRHAHCYVTMEMGPARRHLPPPPLQPLLPVLPSSLFPPCRL